MAAERAGTCLQALGRLVEARAPMQAGQDPAIAREDWMNAAVQAGNLAELHLALGDLARAEELARRSVELADQIDVAVWRMNARAALADVQHQRGQASSAAELFAEAEAIQAVWQPVYPLLYAVRGYQYCDLLLERGPTARRTTPRCANGHHKHLHGPSDTPSCSPSPWTA